MSVIINGTTGITTPAEIISNGTINGVLYLDSSKNVASGSALTFDGANLGVGTNSPSSYTGKLVVIGSGIYTNYGYALTSDSSYFVPSGASAIPNYGVGAPTSSTVSLSGYNGLQFFTNQSEQMRLTSTGLGIGTSSPDQKLVVSGTIQSGTTGNNGAFYLGGPNVSLRSAYSANVLGIYTNNTEQVRIDSSGNVGIGTSSPSGRLHVESSSGNLPLYVNSTASAQNVRIRLNSTDNASSVSYVMSYSHASLNKQAAMVLGGTGSIGFYVNQTAGAEPTTGTLAQTIDSSGNVGIGTSSPAARLQADSSSATYSANIRSRNSNFGNFVVGAASGIATLATDMNNIAFYTASNMGVDGTSAPTNERARIDSSGYLYLGNTGSITNGGFVFYPTYNSTFDIGHSSAAASGNKYAGFYYNNSQIGSITQNGTTAVAFNTSSDERLKTNVQPSGSAIQSILDFPVDQFDWIADGSHQDFGGIAQKVQPIIPEMVSVPAGENEMWGIDWSKAVPRLIKTIQEQQDIIKALTARIEALEGAK